MGFLSWWLFMALSLNAAPTRIPDPPCHVRDGKGWPVPCPDADAAVIRAYDAWPAHGPVVRAARLSLGTARTRVAVGEPVRVLHVMESLGKPQLWIMGPKAIEGELVDGAPRTPPLPAGLAESDTPWQSGTYDGAVLDGPGIDTNFDITEYRFDTPGRHTIEWRLGRWRSNTLVITVVAPAR
ncbi:MAG: hypothetical protein U1F43_28160 [Myxococcota bacterium]